MDQLANADRLTRRRMLQGAAAVAAASLVTGFDGCGSPSAAPAAAGPAPPTPTNAAPSRQQPVPAGPLVQASVSVSAVSAGAIAPAFAGLSYEKGMLGTPLFTGANSNLIALFQRLGPSVLRIGGNSVDKNVWTPQGAGQTPGQIAPPDVDALAAFVKATGWQCLYGVNLGGAASGATSPAMAAAEVQYAAQQLGSALAGIEIGNECDLYGGTGHYFAGNWSLAQFITLWQVYRQAILASTPAVAITGPASASHEAAWTVPFGQTVTKNEISLLTQHYYRGNGQSPSSTAAALISPDPNLVNDLALLKSGAAAIGVPYRMAECNSYYNGGADGVSDSYASALWVIDFLFNCAQGGAVGVNFHGGGNSSGYTPIANSGGSVIEARPEYYGMLLFALAGPGALYATQVAAASLNVTGYAIKTADGLNLVLVNKDPTQNLQMSVTLPQPMQTATLLAMTQSSGGAAAPQLTATSGVSIQGAAVNPDGTFAPAPAYTLTPSGSNQSQLTCYLPALSAVLIQAS